MPYAIPFQKSDVLGTTLLTSASSTTLAGGSFGSPSGIQLYVVDYDVPAKAEVIGASVSGTTVPSVTRGLDGTTNQDHAAGAKIAAMLVPAHYAQLGGLAASDAWTAWNPAPAGFSGTPTVNLARYFQVGKMVWGVIDFTGASSAASLSFTLPVAAKSSITGIGFARAVDAGTVASAPAAINAVAGSPTASVALAPYGTAFWTGSGTKALQGSFFYEAN